MTDKCKAEVARLFITGLRTGDADILRRILRPDAVWSLPGTSAISSAGITFELKHILVGCNGVALSLHNTSRQPHAVFDQYLATVISLEGETIRRIETFMHDVANVNEFFVKPALIHA